MRAPDSRSVILVLVTGLVLAGMVALVLSGFEPERSWRPLIGMAVLIPYAVYLLLGRPGGRTSWYPGRVSPAPRPVSQAPVGPVQRGPAGSLRSPRTWLILAIPVSLVLMLVVPLADQWWQAEQAAARDAAEQAAMDAEPDWAIDGLTPAELDVGVLLAGTSLAGIMVDDLPDVSKRGAGGPDGETVVFTIPDYELGTVVRNAAGLVTGDVQVLASQQHEDGRWVDESIGSGWSVCESALRDAAGDGVSVTCTADDSQRSVRLLTAAQYVDGVEMPAVTVMMQHKPEPGDVVQ